MKSHVTGFVCALLVTSLGFAEANTKETTIIEETTETVVEPALKKGYELMDNEVLGLKFKEGETKLSATDETSLKALVDAFKSEGKIEKIMIGVWSDKDFPGQKFTEEDKKLAEARADNLKKAVKNLGVDDTEILNMAERPNWFEKKLGMDDAKVKEAMVKPETAFQDHKDTYLASVGKAFLSKGGASRAVVVIKGEEAKVSH